MRNLRKFEGLIALFIVIGWATAASSQTTLGRVTGSVLDTSGAVLPGATITLTNEDTNQVQTTVANESGVYTFPQVPVGNYRVEIALQGFKTASFTKVAVAVGQEYSLTARLELGNVTENVTVEAGASLVPTTSPEVTTTVGGAQIASLPLNGRNPISLIQLQAGVASMGRTNTAINGGRPTWTEVSQDGINIQDNFIRTNSLDFVPNRPTSDNVGEFSIVTTAQGADSAGGSSQVRMITPSGTNTFRGNVYEYNRNSRFAANSFFNQRAGLPVSYLNRNQYGGSFGGPALRNKLFFYANYEAFRQKQQAAQNFTIPVRSDLLTGNFRYVVGSEVRSANLLQLAGLSVDPAMQNEILSLYPSPDKVNSFEGGDSRADRLLNTAQYRFQQDDFNDRNQWVARGDYELANNHRFEVVYSYIGETDDRTDLDLVTIPRPLVFTEAHAHRFVGAWRWTVSSRLQNEVRAGGNLAPVDFKSDVDFASGYLFNVPSIASLSTPVPSNTATGPSFQPQGRNTRTYQFSDTASMMVGNHALQFGGSLQKIKVNAYNFAGRFPTLTFGFSGGAPLNSAQLPGISAPDLATANNLLSYLTGTMTSLTRTFQVESQNSGFVGGIPNDRNWSLDNIASYIQDNWRVKPNVTIRAGVKWEYFSPVREDNNLAFVPVLNGRSTQEVMLDPNATVSFSDGDMWKKDLNNFGPAVGVNWDPFKDGRTSIRAGYSLTFVNEESVTVGTGVGGNAGLSTAVAITNQTARLSQGVPVIPTPEFKSTRTLADQAGAGLTNPLRGMDQDVKQPHVHQLSAGVSREIMWNMAVEARYVGTFGRGIFRGTDLNQIDVARAAGGAYLADFARARQNGFLSQAAGLGFVPDFNAAVPGSQPLTVLPQFGQLANATVRTAIQQNEPARLADLYMSTFTQALGSSARAAFLQNPGIYASEYVFNSSYQDYNALQLELRRQFRHGIMGQVNYTLSETRSDATGAGSQNRIEPLLDNNRPGLDDGLSLYHTRHVVNANAIVELPFGQGKRWLNGNSVVDAVVGGWQLAPIVRWQSGAPLAIESNRGTFNRTGRSDRQTAVTSLSADQIKSLLGVYRLPDGRIFFIDPAVVDQSTGRLVAPDSLSGASFDGQAFFNPGAGEVGTLAVNAFEGPSQFLTDLAISKRVRLGGRYSLSLRADIFNLFDTKNWTFNDIDINSATAGRITATGAARLVQFSGKFEF
jgi:hypothetical protein